MPTRIVCTRRSRAVELVIDKHLTGREVAELLSLDYETVLRLAQTGEIATVRIGRLRRFPESAVQTYLDRRREPERDQCAERA
jgi:excisionase family DNA binding protein